MAPKEGPQTGERPAEGDQNLDATERADTSVEASDGLTNGAETLKAGALHTAYLEKSEQIEQEKAANDKITIKQSLVVDLRKNSRVLNKKTSEQESDVDQVTNLKDETARRLRVYTENRDGEWYTLNYKELGSDSQGATHELNIGLGDILLDPDIKDILIQKKGSDRPIKCHRGPAEDSKHKGRIGFLDEENRYVATHTHDKFKILTEKETNKDNPTEAKTYVEAVKAQDHARETQEIKLLKNNSFGQIETEIPTEESELDPKLTVVEQIKKSLNASQREMASIIEAEFKAAGLIKPNLIAAAIINAYYESSLIADREPDDKTSGERSYGLFMVNIDANPSMTKEDCFDPHKNTQFIINEVQGKPGEKLLASAESGASVQELTRLFSKHIERCVDEPKNGHSARARKSLSWFNKKEIIPTEEYLANKQYETANGEIAKLNLKSNQETWIIGSSIAAGLGIQNRDESIGTFGVIGGDPTEIGNEIENNLKPRIALMTKAGKMTLPKRVILIGMALNGLAETTEDEKAQESARQNLAAYSRIANMLEELGIAVVKISPENLYEKKRTSIMAFNAELKKTPYYLETTLDQAPATELTSDTLHLQEPANNRVFDAEKKLRG